MNPILKYTLPAVFFLLVCPKLEAQQPGLMRRVDSILHLMTLEEKIGQLNQYSGKWEVTGPVTDTGSFFRDIKEGKLGSLLNIRGAERTRELQELAMQSRLKIPLLFGQDVIHGYRTTFPIPLAESCSWDPDAMERAARIAATEAAAAGIHWTFAPMVDISRDPRWGRVMEGAGEDTYLGSQIARARVKGFQGKGPGNPDAVMACVKHFVAYGAAIGGRDYNSVDISDRSLWETYLPPFKAAVDAGAATVMNGFNDLNGVPVTGSSYLLKDILKNRWSFKGFVVSDWGSVREMVTHGYVKDRYEAAISAITAGSDMDMEGRCYINYLVKAVKEKRVLESDIDDAVKRILLKKFEMGLFDAPYQFCNSEREKSLLNNAEHRKIAREIACKSIVLLKNSNNILPLLKKQSRIAVIGPLMKSKKDMLGAWSVKWSDTTDIISQYEGIQNKLGHNANLVYAKGCEVTDSSRAGFPEALEAARQSDLVIVSVGEYKEMSGEAKSRSDIHLPGVQEALVKALCATGKPVVVLINAGRPLVFNWIADNAPAILYTWWLGSEAGNAIADVLFGDYNPSAKLTMSFPANEGQIPVYYNYLNTGKPDVDYGNNVTPYRSGYIDLQKQPKYPFGFGLSYTTFKYSDLELNSKTFRTNETITVSCKVSNTGKYAGEEIVQLYIRDRFASLVRPVKELKGFRKVMLVPGQTQTITFSIDTETVSFYDQKLQWVAEPGDFDIMIGSSSKKIELRSECTLL